MMKSYLKSIKEGRLQEMWKQTKWIYGYAKHYWGAMVLYTMLGMTTTAIGLFSGLVSRDLVDIITGHQAGEVVKTFVMMIVLGLVTAVVGQISDYASNYISMKVDAEIKADIFSKILVTDWESLTNYHTGDLLTRWSSDASGISVGVLTFIPNALIDIVRFVSAFAMVIYFDASFAVFAFLSMPVSLLMSRKLMNRMINNNQKSAAMGAKMSGFNQETFSNIQVIKAFDLINLYIKRLKEIQKEYINMRLDFQKMSMVTSFILTTVGLLVSYASYGWGIYRVWSGAISYGTMTMFLSLSGTLTGTLHSLTSLVPTAIGLTTSAGRLMDIVEMPQEDFSKNEEVQEFIAEHKEKGIGIAIEQVDYTYQNGTQVFEGASMEAYPHEVISLIGPSGEGKATMMRLVLSLIQSQDGKICIKSSKESGDEMEISPATRQLFSYVPQGNTMFSGTIAENMRSVKPEATEEEIIEALKMACAWEFVEKLPQQIYSYMQERGGGFSEGQAQRLSIARALLRHSPILLLDEATSALDAETEKRVLRNIMEDTYPRSCIVTTHRTSVLKASTRVYRIADKKCQELFQDEIADLLEQ